MPKNSKKRRLGSKTNAGKSKPVKKRVKKHPAAADEAAFTEALIESGQAAPLDSQGKLPAGATHKIVTDEAGQLKVVRRRFSMT